MAGVDKDFATAFVQNLRLTSMSALSIFRTRRASALYINNTRPIFIKNISSQCDKNKKKIEECYNILNIPPDSKQDVVRKAFLDLAKKYHPDSGSPEADRDKFITIEKAFRTLTRLNTGKSSKEEVEKILYNVKHTTPQHRQYLSFEGVGHGTPYQRQKQWAQVKAQKAATNVLEHRMSKAIASENTLMKKGQYGKKHDIKTKYGFDRLVEDLIQESMSKGEFENLGGKGKPLKDQNINPYVDFTTHKLNEVLINNGFTPEWITMSKEIDQDIQFLKNDVKTDRSYLGPYPLNEFDQKKWDKICEDNRYIAQTINMKINKYNLIVPLINKQKLHVPFDLICDEILRSGNHSVVPKQVQPQVAEQDMYVDTTGDLFSILFKGLGELLSFSKENKKAKN